MRWCWLLLFSAAACTSAWSRREAQLAQHESDGQYALAIADERWLIDNAFAEAPVAERSSATEAERYLRLARLAVHAGRMNLAVEALRQALASDPHQAPAVRAAVAQLPLRPADLERRKQEFEWNIAALAPAEDSGRDPGDKQCWSYRVREVRVRQRRTVRGSDGLQRELTYDARPWMFQARSRQWQAEGPWMNDVGTEVESVAGPEQPRYRALSAAEHEFVSDEPVPPCHRTAWQGPYDASGRIFVATRLPVTESEAPQ